MFEKKCLHSVGFSLELQMIPEKFSFFFQKKKKSTLAKETHLCHVGIWSLNKHLSKTYETGFFDEHIKLVLSERTTESLEFTAHNV